MQDRAIRLLKTCPQHLQTGGHGFGLKSLFHTEMVKQPACSTMHFVCLGVPSEKRWRAHSAFPQKHTFPQQCETSSNGTWVWRSKLVLSSQQAVAASEVAKVMIEPTAFAPGLAAVPRAIHQQQASNKLNLPSDQKNLRIFAISKKAKH